MNLLDNPFHILGASPRDDRRRILELSEERSLTGDAAKCAKARSDLSNPRSRIAAEVAWIPGTPAEIVTQIAKSIEGKTAFSPTAGALGPLGAANAIASALTGEKAILTVDQAAQRIESLALNHERTDLKETLDLINLDRQAAGFPAVEATSLQQPLEERRLFYKDAIWAALDRMPSRDIVAAVTKAAEATSARGTKQAPLLVDEIVDGFSAEAKSFLEVEAEHVRKLLTVLVQAAEAGAPQPRLETLLDALERVVRNWDFVAQPIQVSSMSRGLDHEPSLEVATEIRDLALVLNNEHGHLWASQRLTRMALSVFAEVPRIVELLEKDALAINRLAASQGGRRGTR